MNVPNIEKLKKTLDICIELNNSIGDMSEMLVCQHTKEGFSAAADLIQIAIKTKDIKLFSDIFDKTRQLVAIKDKFDATIRREIIKQQDVFDRLIIKKLSNHPSFTIKVILPNISKVK
jgi:hypothetical protein